MALINCPECGKQVSDRAKKCPHCGHNISKYLKNKVFTENKKNLNDENTLENTVGKSNIKRKKNVKNVIVGIIVVIIISTAIFLVVNQKTSKSKEDTLQQTHSNILTIENNIGNIEDGYKEKIELFGMKGMIIYTNTLEAWIDYTNIATWQPEAAVEVEKIYEDIVELYGDPVNDGGTYWSWQEVNGKYRIVLQHGSLGLRLVIQKEVGED